MQSYSLRGKRFRLILVRKKKAKETLADSPRVFEKPLRPRTGRLIGSVWRGWGDDVGELPYSSKNILFKNSVI